jgi:hypothetical protein
LIELVLIQKGVISRIDKIDQLLRPADGELRNETIVMKPAYSLFSSLPNSFIFRPNPVAA